MEEAVKVRSPFAEALKASAPVLAGYVAIGLAFGLLLVSAGLPWYLAPIMSLLVYAGALQYAAVGLIAGKAGIGEIALTALLINARHLAYGLSLRGDFPARGPGRLYMIFALTDETYALLTGPRPRCDFGKYAFWVSLLDQSYWTLASAAGAIAGSVLPIDTRGLDFALTALFAVLLVEQAKTAKRSLPFIVGVAAAAAGFVAFGAKGMLLAAFALSIAALLPFAWRMSRE